MARCHTLFMKFSFYSGNNEPRETPTECPMSDLDSQGSQLEMLLHLKIYLSETNTIELHRIDTIMIALLELRGIPMSSSINPLIHLNPTPMAITIQIYIITPIPITAVIVQSNLSSYFQIVFCNFHHVSYQLVDILNWTRIMI